MLCVRCYDFQAQILTFLTPYGSRLTVPYDFLSLRVLVLFLPMVMCSVRMILPDPSTATKLGQSSVTSTLSHQTTTYVEIPMSSMHLKKYLTKNC
ncbi:hypothetical protein C0J52_04052 [Blattella germanica]|nr:hypothetical protein C0J52_04052 [Blattella germanica]